jgi:hypothetical protein
MTESIELIQLLSKSYFNWINSFAFRLFLLWVPFVSHFGSFHFFDFEDLRKTLNSTKTTPYRHCNFKTKHHVWPPDKIGLLLQYLWITNFCITKLHFLNVQRFFFRKCRPGIINCLSYVCSETFWNYLHSVTLNIS